VRSVLARPAASLKRTLAARTIPSSDAVPLRSAIIRTRTLLILLPLLPIVLAALLVRAPKNPQPVDAALRTGSHVVVVIDLSASTLKYSYAIGQALSSVTNDPSSEIGLVLVSDAAYMALPPTTPSAAAAFWGRMISETARYTDFPWGRVYSHGTRLSAGLERARQALRSVGIKRGRIFLITDLADAHTDLPQVSAVISRIRKEKIDLRTMVVGQNDPQLRTSVDWNSAAFVLKSARSVITPEHTNLTVRQPPARKLVLLALGLALILAACEIGLARLDWLPARGEEKQ
jgi:hypothetical protein